MPEDGIDLTESTRLLSTEEVVRVSRLFVAAGVDKIRLTGGKAGRRRPFTFTRVSYLFARLAGLTEVNHVFVTDDE